MIPAAPQHASPPVAPEGRLGASGFAVALALLLSACAGDAPPPPEEAGPEIVYSPAVPLGAGNMRTYVVSEGGLPVELGVAFDEATLATLPPQHGPGSIPMPDGNSTYQYVLELPAGHGSPFQFALVDWNPGGHEPPGIYDIPHLDLHFYLVSDETRMGIDPMNPEFMAMAAAMPAPELMPPGHIHPMPEPTAVPMMGVHWLDPTSPEVAGTGPFTNTYIYGTWNGELIFTEPMITVALLQTRPNIRQTVPVPARYATPGHYPTEYLVRWDEGAQEYRVALSGFQPAG